MTKQCICPHCGRIAEVRRRSNGQNLRYLYCKNKCGGLTSAAGASQLEKIEVDHLGEIGEFPNEAKPEAQTHSETNTENLESNSKTTQHWQPEPEETPEALESEQTEVPKETQQTVQPKDETNELSGTGVVLTLLSIFGFIGGGIWLNSKKKKR